MSGWGCCLVILGLLLAGALLFTLTREYLSGSAVHAEYPQRVSFFGAGRYSRMTYYGMNWHWDAHDPRPCPLVIHLASGDVGAADFAAPAILPARGWTDVTDDQGVAMGLPQVLEHRGAGYYVHLYYAGGALTCVAVGVQPVAPTKPDARGIAVSIQGCRVSLPVPERELIRVLGTPARRTQWEGDSTSRR